jgi:hypothetical protein
MTRVVQNAPVALFGDVRAPLRAYAPGCLERHRAFHCRRQRSGSRKGLHVQSHLPQHLQIAMGTDCSDVHHPRHLLAVLRAFTSLHYFMVAATVCYGYVLAIATSCGQKSGQRPPRLEPWPATISGGRRLYFPQLVFSRLYTCICSAPKWRRLTSGIFVYRHCSCVTIKFKFIKYSTCIWTFSPCYIIACNRQVHGSRFELTVSKKPISIYLEITVSKTTKFDCF